MKTASPFTLNRFEFEGHHLYFLQKKLFENIEQPKPVYIVGSRGTGKTTLLQALNWRERLDNKSLQKQLEGDVFSKHYIGIYFKLPEIQLGRLREWLRSSGRHSYATLFAWYLDLVWIEELLNAIAELIARGIFLTSSAEEQKIVSQIGDQFSYVFKAIGEAQPVTLRELAHAIIEIRQHLESQAVSKASHDDVIKRFRIGQIGEFGKNIARDLSRLCFRNDDEPAKKGDWFFKICMDEGECLDEFEQVVMNSLVRLAKHPVFPVVSFVRMPANTTTTHIDNLTLQQADRSLIELDSMSLKDFQELTEGIATVRVRDRLKDEALDFSAKRILGELDINSLLHSILNNSVSPKAKELLSKAKELSKHQFFVPDALLTKEKNVVPTHKRESLPIYQAYLVEKLKLDIPSPGKQRWKRRKQDSAELRKKIVAAYLSICHEINTDVRYASADMVFMMSDMCVRDFLHQIDIIYHHQKWSLGDFLKKKVNAEIQDKSLKFASNEKKNSVPERGVSNPAETGAIIRGLAKITAIIQSRSISGQHLKSSERGIFVLARENQIDDKQWKLNTRALKEAAEAGFLRLLFLDENGCKFRVHTSLAAAYGFSYRGAYYECGLQWSDIDHMRKIKVERELDAIADQIGNRLCDTTNQKTNVSKQNLDLFD